LAFGFQAVGAPAVVTAPARLRAAGVFPMFRKVPPAKMSVEKEMDLTFASALP